MKLEWTKQVDETLCRYVVTLSSEVTEDFESVKLKSLENQLGKKTLSEAAKEVPATEVVFDFLNLQRLNSLGVRALLNLIAIVPREFAISYRHCVSAFVEHLNIMPDFLQRGTVESLVITEYCPDGHSPQSRLLTVGKEIRKGVLADEAMKQLPKAYCKRCATELEFHEVPSLYFSFLERMK